MMGQNKETLGSWAAEQVLKEEKSKIKTIVAIYPGRFQPMGQHHAKTYKWLAKQFGEKDTYVVTSDKVQLPKSPFDFNEKKKIINKHGIKNVVKVKNPYVAEEVLKKYDPETTAVVFMYGAKDAGRIKTTKKDGSPSYFQDFKKNKNNLVGYQEHGYIIVAPHVSLKVPGQGEMSGTSIRAALGDDSQSPEDMKKIFKAIFGFYDDKIFKMVTSKLGSLRESIATFIRKRSVAELIAEVSKIAGGPTAGQDVDDGPGFMYGNKKSYEKWNKKMAERLGMEVVNYLIGDEQFDTFDTSYPGGPIDSVSFFPAGIASGASANNREDLRGRPAYNKWVKHIKRVAGRLGMEFVNFTGAEESIPSSKKEPKKDLSGHTINEDRNPVMDKEIDYEDKQGNKKTTTVGGALKQGEGHPAYKKARKMVDKSGEEDDNSGKAIAPQDFLTPAEKEAQAKAKQQQSEPATTDSEPEVTFEPDNKDLKGVKFKAGAKLKEKLKNFSKKEKEYFAKGMKAGSEERKTLGQIIKRKAKGVIKGVKRELKHQKHVLKDVGGALVGLAKGKKPTKEQVKSLKTFGTTVGLTVASMALTGGVGSMFHHGAGAFAKHLGVHLAEHMAGEAALFGLGKAALFADTETEMSADQAMEGFVNKFAEVIANGEVPPEVIEKVIDSYNKEKAEKGEPQDGQEVAEAFFSKKSRALIEVARRKKFSVIAEAKLLLEGGAYGHMAHPFDDKDLTFGDFKEIIDKSLQGRLDLEQSATEKTDGQNLMVTWKDGKLGAARNKTTIKDPMDISQVQTKFEGRGDIRDAFVYAMEDLEKAIGALSEKDREKIFKGGKAFMNLEIIYPKTENVINYDLAVLQFHGAVEYDENANAIGAIPSGGQLQQMIKKANANVQKHFKIIEPQALKINPHQDYTKKKSYFISKLKKLQSKYNLKDKDTLALYHQNWWEERIRKEAKKSKYTLPNNVLVGLTKRWAFFDKGYSVANMKKEIDNDKFLAWALKFDKEDHKKVVKENMYPFETLFFELGAEILKNAEGFLAANPDKAVQKIKQKVKDAIADVEKGGDLKKLQKVKDQMKKIEAVGGFQSIVPAEGLVFIYKGNTYKFTGAFAPVNQITGLMTFTR